MEEPCCKECGLRPARYSLDYWHRHFGPEPAFCRPCAEKLASRVARDGTAQGGPPLSREEIGFSHKATTE